MGVDGWYKMYNPRDHKPMEVVFLSSALIKRFRTQDFVYSKFGMWTHSISSTRELVSTGEYCRSPGLTKSYRIWTHILTWFPGDLCAPSNLRSRALETTFLVIDCHAVCQSLWPWKQSTWDSPCSLKPGGSWPFIPGLLVGDQRNSSIACLDHHWAGGQGSWNSTSILKPIQTTEM